MVSLERSTLPFPPPPGVCAASPLPDGADGADDAADGAPASALPLSDVLAGVRRLPATAPQADAAEAEEAATTAAFSLSDGNGGAAAAGGAAAEAAGRAVEGRGGMNGFVIYSVIYLLCLNPNRERYRDCSIRGRREVSSHGEAS